MCRMVPIAKRICTAFAFIVFHLNALLYVTQERVSVWIHHHVRFGGGDDSSLDDSLTFTVEKKKLP